LPGWDHVRPFFDLKVFRLRLQFHRQARREAGEARKKSGVERGEIQNRRPISFGSQLALDPVSREGSDSLPSPLFIATRERDARGKSEKSGKNREERKRSGTASRES